MHSKSPSPEAEEVTRRYFELSVSIEHAKQQGDYKASIAAARETLLLLKRFVAAIIKEYGRWDIGLSHAVHTAGPLMAVEEDREAIADLRATLQTIPELSSWLLAADQAEEDLAIVGRIKRVIRAQPGVHQTDLKGATAFSDGKRLSVLVGYLERGGHIRRVRTGKTYELYPAELQLPAPKADMPTPTASLGATPASSPPR